MTEARLRGLLLGQPFYSEQFWIVQDFRFSGTPHTASARNRSQRLDPWAAPRAE
jgi:hypothetical protein